MFAALAVSRWIEPDNGGAHVGYLTPQVQLAAQDPAPAEIRCPERAGRLAMTRQPAACLRRWPEYVSYLGTKHALIDGLNRGSESFRTCLDALRAAGAPLLLAAQQAALVRDDIDIDDTMRLVNAVTAVAVRDDSQQALLLGVVLDGITTR